MAVDRRQVLMGGVAGVLLILVAWSFWPSAPASTTPPVRTNAQGRANATGAPQLGPLAPVKLDSLGATRDEPGEAERNPFRFQPKAPPPAPTRAAVTQPVIEAPRAAAPPPGPPPAPPIPLKFTGLVERANGVKLAVLTDGKSVMYGKDGDIIDGRYTIVKIGTESIEMTHADGRGRQVIRLTGQ
jgi:hypothetical protein